MQIDVATESTAGGQPLAVMRLEGELDAASYLDVIERTRQLAGQGVNRLLVDLTELSYMGSSGLFALHSMAMLLRGETPPDPEHGYAALDQAESIDDTVSELKLLSPQPQVQRVLDRTGMTRFFEVHADRATALASF